MMLLLFFISLFQHLVSTAAAATDILSHADSVAGTGGSDYFPLLSLLSFSL